MIFVILGSQKFQFNRLLQAIDLLIEKGSIQESVFAQIGYSDYAPVNFSYEPFLDRDKFQKNIEKANLVITHGGTGAIINAVKKKKKVIAIPRSKLYGEHIDNHQFQIVEEFAKLNLIEPCYEVNELENRIELVRKKKYEAYESNTIKIINSIESFISSIGD